MYKTRIITHNGKFHTDEVFAVATLKLVLKDEVEIIRTRDEEIIKTGDYVVDVGFIYDEEKNLFDHHQVGGAGERANGVPYASFGLVWKKFCRKLSNDDEVADIFDKRIVQFIDATDNLMSAYTPLHNITRCQNNVFPCANGHG